jgi:hypothetical protein
MATAIASRGRSTVHSALFCVVLCANACGGTDPASVGGDASMIASGPSADLGESAPSDAGNVVTPDPADAAPVSCTPSETTECAESHGTGTRTCDSAGLGFGPCAITACDSGYHLDGAGCVIDVCAANTSAACAEGHGSGTHVCNATGTDWGTCVLSACDTGYHFANSLCEANILCAPGSQAACTVAHGSGTQTCVANSASYTPCTPTQCDAGYNPQGLSCVINACQPASVVSCHSDAENFSGTQTCLASGASYGACVKQTCDAFYLDKGSYCLLNCKAGDARSCSISSAIGSYPGTEACALSGTTPIGWYQCTLNQCPPNYSPGNSGCLQRCNLVANSCTVQGDPMFSPEAHGVYACANGTQVNAYLPLNSQCYPYFYVLFPDVPDPSHTYRIENLIGS